MLHGMQHNLVVGIHQGAHGPHFEPRRDAKVRSQRASLEGDPAAIRVERCRRLVHGDEETARQVLQLHQVAVTDLFLAGIRVNI